MPDMNSTETQADLRVATIEAVFRQDFIPQLGARPPQKTQHKCSAKVANEA